MAIEKSDLMEEIREIAFSCTLEEAFNACICIQCHKMLAGYLSDFDSTELDNWLLEGLCPSCHQKSLTTQPATKLKLAR